MKNDNLQIPVKSNLCRVCDSVSIFWFSKKIMNKYDVSYFNCPQCGHIQTESPYWLDEIYKNHNFLIDTGVVSRSIKTANLTLALAWELNIKPDEICLDYGSGTGLFVRYCRDFGMNFFFNDCYSKNVFALGFEIKSHEVSPSISLLTAFEVVEHLPNPREDFKKIFYYNPEYILFSTCLYEGQGQNWWYFLNDGQHISFYTEKSLEIIGSMFGYHYLNYSNYHLFSKKQLPENIIKKVKRKSEIKAKKYKKKFGSRIDSDFESISNCSYIQY